jgi:site-specific recombinase XerD
MPRARAAKPRPEPELLGEADVQRLLLTASERAPTGVRNRALIALLYCSGLRVAEGLALRPEDLDPTGPSVVVGGVRRRAAHLFAPAWPYLETWLALRARHGLPARAPLFCTLGGAALEPAYVRAMLARLARRSGLGKRVHPHLLRHSSAARLARAGVGPAALAEQLGLASARGAVRSLARFGVAPLSTGRLRASQAPWSLAPEPGAVRAVVLGSGSRRPGRPRSSSAVVVRRWRPEEL